MKFKNKVLPFHNFFVNPLRAGLICSSLENPLSMANLPVHFFKNFSELLTLTFFGEYCPYEIKDKHKNNFMREPYFFMFRRLP